MVAMPLPGSLDNAIEVTVLLHGADGSDAGPGHVEPVQ